MVDIFMSDAILSLCLPHSSWLNCIKSLNCPIIIYILQLMQKNEANFEEEINFVSWVLFRFMLIVIPVIFIINVIAKGVISQSGSEAWVIASLLGPAIAAGLTSEMQPMIVIAELVKSVVVVSKKKVVVKNLNLI